MNNENPNNVNEVKDNDTVEVKETETKVEEAKTEEITPIDVTNVELHDMKLDVDTDDLEKIVEDKRLAVHAEYKKGKRLGNIMTVCMVVLVIVSVILITQEGDAFKYAGYGVGGAAILGMLIYWIVNRGKMPNKIQDYMSDVNTTFNAFLYKDQKFERLTMDPAEKVNEAEIGSDRIYAGIAGIGSRNVIHGSFKDHPFLIADVKAVAVGPKNKETELFVGKYLSCENGFKFDGRVIINIRVKGEKVYDIPNDVADLESVETDGELTIWATPGLDYKKIATSDVINKIKHLEVKEDKHLYNVNVVFWGGHTAVYLSYDNTVMSYPFENEFKKEGIEHFKRDQNVIFDLFEMTMKEKAVKCAHVKAKKVEEPAQIQEKVEEKPVETEVEEKPTEKETK